MTAAIELQLGFKAFDTHELLCHFVAEQAGFYKESGLAVELLDITFLADADLPEELPQVSCAAALAAALRGHAQRIVFVATDRPMFWIYGAQGVATLGDLEDKRLATYPAAAPPHHLANMVIRRAGLDPGRVALRPARDDAARVGLLKSGHADAAVVSSAMSPIMLQQAGCNELCMVGDGIRLPSTGLAVNAAFLDHQREVVRSLVRALSRALRLAHGNLQLVAEVLERRFDIGASVSAATAGRYAACLSPDGRTSAEIAQAAVDAMRSSLSIASPVAWESVYDFSLLTA